MLKRLDLSYSNNLNQKVVVDIDSYDNDVLIETEDLHGEDDFVLLSFDQIKCIYREIKSMEAQKK